MRLRQAVLALVLCTLATPGFAQGISGGVKVGVGFNTVSVDPDEGDDISSRTGFVVGGFIEAPISPKISIQPEFLWKQAGAKFSGDDFDGGTATLHLDTFDIPILLKANLGSSSSRPFVVVGPVIGFRTGDAKFTLGDEEQVLDDVSSTDFAIAFGAGVNVKMLSIEVRYNLGVKDLDSSDSSAKSRNFMILAGFGF